ncbi:twin-arginine translocase TatA/TatE family subunit [Edaphobacter sp. HDX4]
MEPVDEREKSHHVQKSVSPSRRIVVLGVALFFLGGKKIPELGKA